MVLKMAFRNLLRHKKRTILTLTTTIIGILLAVIGEGMNSGMEVQITDLSVKSEIGFARAFGKGYYAEKTDNNILEFPIGQEEIGLFNTLPVTKHISFEGTMTNSQEELRVKIQGVNPVDENKVFNRDKYIISGEWIKNREGLVIGSELASLLGVKVGDSVTVLARTIDKNQNAYDLTISGIIKTGNPIFDGTIVFLEESFAKEFVGADFYNEVIFGEKLDSKKVENLKNSNIDLVTYEEELEDFLIIAKIRRKMFGVISGGILLMASLTITNTMLMAMLERKKEIGVLMANGMNTKKILKMFFFEGILNGILGSFLGFVLGSILVTYFQKYGIPFNFNSTDIGVNIPFADRLYLHYNFSKSIIFPFIGILFAGVASYYPAYKATKINPIEAMKG